MSASNAKGAYFMLPKMFNYSFLDDDPLPHVHILITGCKIISILNALNYPPNRLQAPLAQYNGVNVFAFGFPYTHPKLNAWVSIKSAFFIHNILTLFLHKSDALNP